MLSGLYSCTQACTVFDSLPGIHFCDRVLSFRTTRRLALLADLRRCGKKCHTFNTFLTLHRYALRAVLSPFLSLFTTFGMECAILKGKFDIV